MCICVHVCMCVYVYVCVCVCMCVYVYMYVYVYVRACVRACVHACMHAVCMYVRTYVHTGVFRNSALGVYWFLDGNETKVDISLVGTNGKFFLINAHGVLRRIGAATEIPGTYGRRTYKHQFKYLPIYLSQSKATWICKITKTPHK